LIRGVGKKDTAMSFFEQIEVFVANLRSLAAHWRVLLALAVLIAFGTLYLERKLVPSAPPAVTAAKAPSGPSAPRETPKPPAEAPPTPNAPADTSAPADRGEAKPDAGEAAPAESIANQMVDVAARPVALLKGQAKWDEAFKTLSEAVEKVSAAVGKAGLVANGRPLAVFTETDDNGFHFEAMVPLAKAPEGKSKLADGVDIGASPAGKALKFQHRGAYDEIDTTYEAITAYLDEKGLDTKNLFIEEYLTDLKTGGETNLEVDVYVFVK